MSQKALIIVDMQRDFMPGGALPVEGADTIVPIINELTAKFDLVIATLDWHPPDHISFAATHHKRVGEIIRIGGVEQILWPIHCVQNTAGAAFAEGLEPSRITAVFRKGIDAGVDSYSAFFDQAKHRATGLANYLRDKNVDRLYFVGVATEYCVLYSVLDALDLGFHVTLICDACKAIHQHPDDEKKALSLMAQRGATLQDSLSLR